MADLKGLNTVIRNLNKAIAKQQKNITEGGITEGCLIIKADAVKMASIDLGNLRGSAFIMVTGGQADVLSPSFSGEQAGDLSSSHQQSIKEAKSITAKKRGEISGVVAFSAFYAVYVHEMPANYNFNSGENKFLKKSIAKNQKKVLRAIAKHARI